MKNIRSLEKDAAGVLLPFTTKSGKYYPITPGQPIGIKRWNEYEKLRIVLGTGKTFSSLITTLQSIEKLLADDKPFAEIRSEAILSVNSLRRGIVELSQARYNQAFYMATIFILKEGDEITEWDTAKAEAYIEDWQSEGISEVDLFFFALRTVTGFKEHFDNIQKELHTEAERLSVLSSLKKTAKITEV